VGAHQRQLIDVEEEVGGEIELAQREGEGERLKRGEALSAKVLSLVFGGF